MILEKDSYIHQNQDDYLKNNASHTHPRMHQCTKNQTQPIYRVILSVLDPRKCEYLKDYSLDFEHAYMTTYLAYEKHVDTCLPLSDILTSSGRLASGAMSCTAMLLCCVAVKENGVHNEFGDQLDDDELRNGYF